MTLPLAVQKWLTIDLPFGLWTRVGRRKQHFNRIRQVAPMCPRGRAQCLNLANIIEPSVCDGDATLCYYDFDHLLKSLLYHAVESTAIQGRPRGRGRYVRPARLLCSSRYVLRMVSIGELTPQGHW